MAARLCISKQEVGDRKAFLERVKREIAVSSGWRGKREFGNVGGVDMSCWLRTRSKLGKAFRLAARSLLYVVQFQLVHRRRVWC